MAFGCASANLVSSEGSQEPRAALEWASGNFFHSRNPSTVKFTCKNMLFSVPLTRSLDTTFSELVSTLLKKRFLTEKQDFPKD